jgi:hypothetical protein
VTFANSPFLFYKMPKKDWTSNAFSLGSVGLSVLHINLGILIYNTKAQKRGAEASFSKTTGNKTLEFGGVSPSNGLTRYKMESLYFYLI